MKRSISFMFGAGLVVCVAGIPLFAQTAPRTQQDRLNNRADRIERRETRNPDAKTKVEAARDARENVVGKRIEFNDQQRAKLTTMLPSGMSLDDAATGFKNQGQFIAALYASKDLGIPFTDLKAKMTGPNPMSLGQAIKALKPTANANSEVEKAEKQAASLTK